MKSAVSRNSCIVNNKKALAKTYFFIFNLYKNQKRLKPLLQYGITK